MKTKKEVIEIIKESDFFRSAFLMDEFTQKLIKEFKEKDDKESQKVVDVLEDYTRLLRQESGCILLGIKDESITIDDVDNGHIEIEMMVIGKKNVVAGPDMH